MRCPKCNYISFDEMEICGSCKKNISKFSQALHGVIFKAQVPDFLWMQKPEAVPEEDAETAEAEAEDEIALSEEEDGLDMGLEDTAADEPELDLDGPAADEEPQEIEFDMGADAGGGEEPEEPQETALELPQEDEAPELDFALDDDGAAADETGLPDLSMDMDGLDDLELQMDKPDAAKPPAVSLGKTAEAKKEPKKSAKKEKAPAAPEASLDLDLDEFDLSGLTSPAAEAEHGQIEDIGELSLESAAPEKGQKKGGGSQKKGSGSQSADLLSDLSIDGLDLDAPILPPASSAAGKKMRPAAKTGTALDSFDIDLGDLLGGSEKK